MTRYTMLEEDGCIIAAVSGGADSMCLLEVLRELQRRSGFRLKVFHVHHGLRESADGDLRYVAQYCEDRGIPFEAAYVDAAGFAAESGLSVEEAARHLRYKALEQAADRWEQELLSSGCETVPAPAGHGAAPAPAGRTAEAPAGRTAEAPSGRTAEAPAGCTAEAPARCTAEAPAGHGAAPAPTGRIAEARAGRTAEAPTRRTAEAPTGRKAECRIAVAHHMEDQAETVLFNLVRGSRLTGLRGMLPVNGRIIRPLLTCSRGEIEEFLNAHGILWREDETNEDVRYSRNLLRHEVMPLLERINKGAVEHIARAAEEAARAEEFLMEETERAALQCCERRDSVTCVSVPELMRQQTLIRRRVIYGVIADTAGRKKDLQDLHVQAVLQLAQKNGNGRLDVFGGVRVEKVYDKLFFCMGAKNGAFRADAVSGRRWPMDAGEYSCRVLDFDGDLYSVPRKLYTKWLDYDKIGAFPSFRTRREGDRIRLDESGRSKTIARYMIDAKVPAELRGRIVLPASGSEILWIPAGRTDAAEAGTGSSSDSGRISAAYMVSSHTSRILEICWGPAD